MAADEKIEISTSGKTEKGERKRGKEEREKKRETEQITITTEFDPPHLILLELYSAL